MSKKMRVLLIILVVLVLLILAACWGLAGFALQSGDRQSLKEAYQWQMDRYDASFYKTLEKTDYTVKGAENYVLHVELLKNPKKTDRYMILSHGYTDNRMGALKYVSMYMDLGYNCIIYDLRGHGENERTFTSYGVLEGQDLAQIVKDTRQRYSKISQLGLHGESLGAATTITSLKYKPDVDFAVADCGFADIEGVLKAGYKAAGAPAFLVDVADLGTRLRYHYAIKDMRPIDSLADNDIPVLFLHGENDELISSDNSKRMAEATAGYHEFYLIPGAGHAESILKQPKIYEKHVKEFIHEI